MGHSPRSVPDSSGLRVLSVHAHPDDEASKGASMAAAYAQAGAEVLVVTCTGGERGDILVEEVQSCLLYTSPSPRDGLLPRMPSSA